MHIKKALITAALGAGLGAAMLPVAALAVVNVSPTVVKPGGTVTVSASCNAGDPGNAAVTGPGGTAFNVILPSLNSGTAGASGSFTAPTAHGTYTVAVSCSDGLNAGSGKFTVSPTGAPTGGDGGKVDNGLYLLGATALTAVAAGGFVIMRRRSGVNV